MLHFHELQQGLFQNTWVTVGVFDGVHQGHQSLISRMVTEAHRAEVQAVVITFHPHPVVVLGRQQHFQYLTTPEERAEFLSRLGVDAVITQKFDFQLSQMSAWDYMMVVKQSIGLSQLWIGHDFALGHNREGNAAYLQKIGETLGFSVNVVEPLKNSGLVVSSSHIRQLLAQGEVRKAADLLGRPYSLQGKVVPGDQRGRLIGIPTANLELSPEKLRPAVGVYACRAWVGGEMFIAATNIGLRPTFEQQAPYIHVETHLLDFSGDLYGETVQLEFIERLRDEQKFSDIGTLIAQIKQDIERTRRIFLDSA